MAEHRTLRRRVAFVAAIVAALWGLVPLVPAQAGHGDFTTSAATYRIPYADGTTVTANNDHHNHPNVANRVDLGGGDGATIVAAASGIIRGLVDHNGDDFDRGDGLAADGVTVQDDALEHSCLDSDTVAGDCSDYNNYIWIQHPNGEWTKYTHLQTGTASVDQGWSVGDTVLVGQALGLEGDVGSASGSHLHHEVAAIPASAATCPDACPFSPLGGFIDPAWNVVARVCFTDGDDNADGLYTDGESYTTGPCPNTAPTADAGGPYVVDEGSTVALDGSASSDPENAILSYSWTPTDDLTDATSVNPTFSGTDDGVVDLTLEVSDAGGDVTPATALTDTDDTTVTVANVVPTVTAILFDDTIDEGGAVTVTATFTDPGVLDTHTATIDWGDGNGAAPVGVADLAAGVDHTYGDDGAFEIVVAVTDDDGGEGTDANVLTVANLDPTVELDVGDAVSFPGGDYLVVKAGGTVALAAEATDAGSDDLTFTWNGGQQETAFNDGVGPDPDPSPDGTFPFTASVAADVAFATVGVDTLALSVADDDGGSVDAAAGVIVTGTATKAEDQGWWKSQYTPGGRQKIDPALAAAYLDIVEAVSTVFSEAVPLTTAAEAEAVLAPPHADRRAQARGELLVAWLHFASGAVAPDATVTLPGGDVVGYLDLLESAEGVILDPDATNAELQAVGRDLHQAKRAG